VYYGRTFNLAFPSLADVIAARVLPPPCAFVAAARDVLLLTARACFRVLPRFGASFLPRTCGHSWRCCSVAQSVEPYDYLSVSTTSKSSAALHVGKHCDTSSAIVAEAVSGSHILKIDGYSRIKELLQNGTYVKSVTSSIGGHNWTIRYYPNGYKKEDTDFISLFLDLDSSVEKDVKTRMMHRCRHTTSSVLCTHSQTKVGPGAMLEGSAHLKDDCFTVNCVISVMKEIRSEETKRKQFVQVPSSNLHQHLGDLLNSMDGTDVTFKVGEEMFSAHRLVLAARSAVFKAELFGEMVENTKRLIQIDDVEAHVFRHLLHFIYTDALPDMALEEGSDGAGDAVAMAQHLLVAADRYNVERLKLICEEKLCRHLDSNMVATSLALAEQHNCRGLKEACFEFLSSPSNLEAMLASDSYEHLKSSCASVLNDLIARLIDELKAAKDVVTSLK
ncbi:hypothetical protein EJB05_56523, partial [Eragrostis curvula]